MGNIYIFNHPSITEGVSALNLEFYNREEKGYKIK